MFGWSGIQEFSVNKKGGVKYPVQCLWDNWVCLWYDNYVSQLQTTEQNTNMSIGKVECKLGARKTPPPV